MDIEKLLNKKKFKQIIKFYLFECPVQYSSKKKVSQIGKTFDQRGLGNKSLNTLRAAMIRVSKAQLNTIKGDPVIPDGVNEYLIVHERTDMSKINSYFYSIRNSFAHGQFEYDQQGYFIFENHAKGKLQAIGRIHENTLLKWIDLCNMNVSELRKVK